MNAVFYLTPKSSVVFLNGDSTVKQGLDKMRNSGFAAVPVIDKEGKYIGTVSEGDFLWFLYDLARNGNKELLDDAGTVFIKDIITPEKYKAVHVDVSERDLIIKAMEQNFVPVIDDRQMFIGIVTRRTILSKIKAVKKEAKTV